MATASPDKVLYSGYGGFEAVAGNFVLHVDTKSGEDLAETIWQNEEQARPECQRGF